MKKKKLKLIGIGLVVLTIILGITFTYKIFFKTNNKMANLIDIKVNDLNNKIKNKESFVVVISQTGCSHCEQYLPELNKALNDYDLKVYVLNISGISDEENKILAQHLKFSGTPTTIFFKDGEEKTTLNRIVGYISKDKIIEKFKALEYIK